MGGKNPDYPKQVADYNAWLYTPMDRRPNPNPQQPYVPDPTLSQYTAPGFHSTSPDQAAAIANRYTPGGTPGYTPPPVLGAAGSPAGMGGATGGYAPQPSIIDTAPKATYQAGPTPPQNAMQRWSAPQGAQQGAQAQGVRPLSDQRRYFWATGHIDAHATQANPSQNKGAIAPVTFNNTRSTWNAW